MSDSVSIEIADVDDDVMIAAITCAGLTIEVIGRVTIEERVLRIRQAHVQGAYPGALGRSGLNAIGRRLLEETDVDQVVIEGGARTTGRNPGRAPRPFRYPSRLHPCR
jgi:hypothetical protein